MAAAPRRSQSGRVSCPLWGLIVAVVWRAYSLGSVVCDGGRPRACFPAVVLVVASYCFSVALPPYDRTAQKLSVGAGMCATLAATSAFLEAVNLTLGPTERVPADVKRTLSGLGGTEAVRRVGWGR